MSAIESFIDKTTHATKSRSKEIRLTLLEAQIISSEISAMLANENKLLVKIVKLQDNIATPPVAKPSGDTVMDGGGFK